LNGGLRNLAFKRERQREKISMTTRIQTGAVAGGNTSRALPPGLEVGDWPSHAAGRLNAMAELLASAMFLKMKGFAKAVTSYKGADYQDFKGSNDEAVHRVAAAHRALFALCMDGTNLADLPAVKTRMALKTMVTAPQARTDSIIAPANYADSLLEGTVNEVVYAIMKAAVALQAADAPFKLEPAIAAMGQIKQAIEQGMVQARANFENRQLMLSAEAQAQSGFSFSSVTEHEIDVFIDGIKEDNIGFYRSNRPTRYYQLVVDALSFGFYFTSISTIRLASRQALEDYLQQLENAAK
jgi:hypothetical protein